MVTIKAAQLPPATRVQSQSPLPNGNLQLAAPLIYYLFQNIPSPASIGRQIRLSSAQEHQWLRAPDLN